MNAPADRRETTRERIVEAATRLLHEDGPTAVTTRRVAELASVQGPVIYRLFGDKDGLLDAVAEHVMATFVAAKVDDARAAADADADPVDELRTGWRTYIDFGLANPTLYALLTDPNRARRSPATRAGESVLAGRVARIARAGRLAVSERQAASLVHAAGTGVLVTQLALPAEQRDAGLADAMLEAVLGRILADAPARHDRPEVAAAVSLQADPDRLTALSEPERGLLAEWLERIVRS